MSDALPAASAIPTYRITSAHTPFLTRHQVVQVDMQDLLVSLVSAAMQGPSNLVSCRLTPPLFRTFVILLLAAPEVVSYATLYAGYSCSDECLEALLSTGSLHVAAFQALVQKARARLAPLGAEELKRQLVPIRHALSRLNQTLALKQFGWTAVNKYRIGYALSRRNQR